MIGPRSALQPNMPNETNPCMIGHTVLAQVYPPYHQSFATDNGFIPEPTFSRAWRGQIDLSSASAQPETNFQGQPNPASATNTAFHDEYGDHAPTFGNDGPYTHVQTYGPSLGHGHDVFKCAPSPHSRPRCATAFADPSYKDPANTPTLTTPARSPPKTSNDTSHFNPRRTTDQPKKQRKRTEGRKRRKLDKPGERQEVHFKRHYGLVCEYHKKKKTKVTPCSTSRSAWAYICSANATSRRQLTPTA